MSNRSGTEARPDAAPSSNAGSSNTRSQGGGSRRSGGGRGRGNRNQGPANQSRFQGQEPSLKDCTFDYSEDSQSKRYIRNIELLVGYIGTNYNRHNMHFQKAVEQLELPDPPPVKRPKDMKDLIEVEEWKLNYKAREEQMLVYEGFRSSLFSLLLGQCTPLLRDKLRAKSEYQPIQDKRDGVALLKLIKATTFTYDSNRLYTAVSRDRLKEEFFSLRRKNNQTIQAYYEVFRAKYKVLEELNIVLYDEDFAAEIAKREKRSKVTDEDRKEAQERCVAVRFIRTCGQKDYESHLQNTFLDGQNNYPSSLAEARAIIDNRLMSNRHNQNNQVNVNQTGNESATGVAYHTQGVSSDDTSTLTENTSGAGTQESGNRGQGTVTSSSRSIPPVVTDSPPAFSFAASSSQASIPPNWILLDNQSTVDIIVNQALLKNIHSSDHPITVSSHAGSRILYHQGLLPGYGLVWYDKAGPANILSLHNAQARFHITYNSVDGNSFELKDPATGRLKHTFHQSPEGLFYMDSSNLAHGSFLTTVSTNERGYSPREVSRAKLARNIQARIGRPSTRDFIKIVEGNMLPNTPINAKDIRRAETIYGPDLGSLKGKTTRRKAPVVDTEILVPPSIKDEHKDITLAMDVMHVNGIPFLLATTRKIRFGMVEALPRLTEDAMMTAIKRIVGVLRRGDLRPRVLLFDGALAYESFQHRLNMLGIQLNTTAQDEHVGEAERFIRTVKDRMRSAFNMLPYATVPKVMVIELAKFVVFWLNSFPNKNGISTTMSPREIVTGEKMDYRAHCRYEFGQYVQCHEQHDNSMAPRTIGALALRPTGNRQGSYYFLSLDSGRVITRNNATTLPMPDEVIKRVEALAAAQSMQPGLAFSNRDNRILSLDDDNPLFNEADDDTYVDDDKSDEDLRYDDDMVAQELEPAVDHPEATENPGVGENQGVMEDLGVEELVVGEEMQEEEPAAVTIDDVQHDAQEEDDIIEEDAGSVVEDEESQNNQEDNEVVENNEGDVETLNESMEIEFNDDQSESSQELFPDDHQHGAEMIDDEQPHYNLRPNRARDYRYRYGHSFACLDSLPKGRYDGYLYRGIVYLTLTEVNQSTPQYPMKYGLKLFGDKGVAAVKKEMQQLHDRGVIRAVHRSDLSWSQIKAALGYLMFLKRKRCGKIKGRGCADGRKQRSFIDKADSASPTVSTDAVFFTAIIDAIERRDVAIIDIPGAFMHSDMDPNVFMRLDGLMAELLLEVDREMYEPYVTYEKGKPVIYVEMLKALYGTLRAARLFWERLSRVLVSWGFVINPYDSCVANKWVNGKQCTITWHIDDLKVSHDSAQVVTHILEDLKSEFGRLGELSVSRGKRHDYLGMYLDFSEDGVLQVDMRPYIATIMDDLPKQMRGRSRTPAALHLNNTRDNATKLDKDKADQYHSITMQLSYLAQRGRPDIRTAVAFLCTRVASPDEDDYRKLCRVLKYLQSTFDLVLRLEANTDGVLRWWADASYAAHPDMKGHTGGCMTMGKGVSHAVSSKQKLVARSSTESELIGVHDVMPSLLWSQNFLQAQGVKVKDVVLMQDNKSTILLEKNGRRSSSKRTKHINVRYFFVTDKIQQKALRVEYCPTEEMLADFFTKPLQGNLFYRVRDSVMNIVSTSPYHSSQRSVLERNQEQSKEQDDQTATSKDEEDEEGWILVKRRGKAQKKTTDEQRAHSIGNI